MKSYSLQIIMLLLIQQAITQSTQSSELIETYRKKCLKLCINK